MVRHVEDHGVLAAVVNDEGSFFAAVFPQIAGVSLLGCFYGFGRYIGLAASRSISATSSADRSLIGSAYGSVIGTQYP